MKATLLICLGLVAGYFVSRHVNFSSEKPISRTVVDKHEYPASTDLIPQFIGQSVVLMPVTTPESYVLVVSNYYNNKGTDTNFVNVTKRIYDTTTLGTKLLPQ